MAPVALRRPLGDRPHLAQPGLDARDVVAHRVVQAGDHGQGDQQGERPVEQRPAQDHLDAEGPVPQHPEHHDRWDECVGHGHRPLVVEIRAAAQAGLIVVAHERELENRGWRGSGYVIIDPVSGGSMSGRLGGGASAVIFTRSRWAGTVPAS